MNRRAAGRGATARQRAQEDVRMRRLHGYRIKKGLDELGELDATAAQTSTTTASSATQATQDTPSCKRPREADNTNETDGQHDTTSDINAVEGSASDTHGSVFGADWTMWRRAKDILFSPSAAPATRQAMLDEMQLWHARARKARPLPPYIEATELLLQCVVLDERRAVTNSFLAQSYGAALSRAVHVMTGSFATQQASTYRARARTIGFPEEAVEVRQRVAHGALPALSELRWVCGLVLQFLFERYWLVQEQHIIAMEREQHTVEQATKDKTHRSSSASQAKKKSNSSSSSSGDVTVPPSAPPKLSVEEIKDLLRSLGDDDDSSDNDGVEEGKASNHTANVTKQAKGEGNVREADEKAAKPPSAATRGVIAGWTLQ